MTDEERRVIALQCATQVGGPRAMMFIKVFEEYLKTGELKETQPRKPVISSDPRQDQR